jgi:hypothetical protein
MRSEDAERRGLQNPSERSATNQLPSGRKSEIPPPVNIAESRRFFNSLNVNHALESPSESERLGRGEGIVGEMATHRGLSVLDVGETNSVQMVGAIGVVLQGWAGLPR